MTKECGRRFGIHPPPDHVAERLSGRTAGEDRLCRFFFVVFLRL
jgi:hypothetical protein